VTERERGDVDHEVLVAVCACVGLDANGAIRLSGHATGVFVLPASSVVVRIGAGPGRVDQARRAVAMARWLGSQDFPATRPIDVSQPVVLDGVAATFWTYYPSTPTARGPPTWDACCGGFTRWRGRRSACRIIGLSPVCSSPWSRRHRWNCR
jgi:hypothetical protein